MKIKSKKKKNEKPTKRLSTGVFKGLIPFICLFNYNVLQTNPFVSKNSPFLLRLLLRFYPFFFPLLFIFLEYEILATQGRGDEEGAYFIFDRFARL